MEHCIKKRNSIVVSLLAACLFMSQAAHAEKPGRLVFASSSNIKDKKEGLKEPSGLALSKDRGSLWTVSDSTSKVFLMKLDGSLRKGRTISDSRLDELEGVAVSGDGRYLYLAREDSNEVIQVDIERKEILKQRSLAKMGGYEGMVKNMPAHFAPSLGNNKGLEGIAVHPGAGGIYLLKESGLLINVAADLSNILAYRDLDFADDYSGICFENASKNRLWVSSDKSKRIYLLDLDSTKKPKAFKLKDVNGKTYSSAEGIAYNPDKRELYVVTDKGHTLYTYKVE